MFLIVHSEMRPERTGRSFGSSAWMVAEIRSAAVKFLMGSVARLMRMAASRLEAVTWYTWIGRCRPLVIKFRRRENMLDLVGFVSGILRSG